MKADSQQESSQDDKLAQLLRNVERASRPITFETIDLILKNKEADKIVEQLSGIAVNDDMRAKKAA